MISSAITVFRTLLTIPLFALLAFGSKARLGARNDHVHERDGRPDGAVHCRRADAHDIG